MTDIPRGQGGDGSPQLDLDHVAECLDIALSHPQAAMQWTQKFGGELVALVRRLQQQLDNDARYYGNVSGMLAELAAKDAAIDALRGRVEELTALLARFVDDEPCHYDHHGYCQTHALGEMPCENEVARIALAKVVPETETP